MIDLARRPAHAESAEPERLGDEIAELAAHLHAATYELLVKLKEFDRLEGLGRRLSQLRALAELADRDRAGRGAREGAGRTRARVAAADLGGDAARPAVVREGAGAHAHRDP